MRSNGCVRGDLGGNSFPLSIVVAIMTAINVCLPHGTASADEGVDLGQLGFSSDAVAAADMLEDMQAD